MPGYRPVAKPGRGWQAAIARDEEDALASSFEAIWDGIQRALQPGATVLNWGLARGYTGGSFKIDDMDRSSVTVFGGKMIAARRVSKGEFEKLHAVWDAYRARRFPRSDMRALSQNTTYILSILRLVDPGAR